MNTKTYKTVLSVVLIGILIISNLSALGYNYKSISNKTNIISFDLEFSDPELIIHDENITVHINESDINMIVPDRPVLPVNITTLEFELGTKIKSVTCEHSCPEDIYLEKNIARGLKRSIDKIKISGNKQLRDGEVYPSDWIYYHAGGGLSFTEHVTFFVLRTYPVRYFKNESKLQFIRNITVEIEYEVPDEPILNDNDIYDLLIITPSKFSRYLKPLVIHKNNLDVKTRIVTSDEIYKQTYWQGRDNQEKIKFYIKNAIEYWGISHVLLVGGLKGQSLKWNLPARYSNVVPYEEGDHAEFSFISDLYYADIYDSEGNFSSWDNNNNNIFSEWDSSVREYVDLYPDVYLGRIPCRNSLEVRIMVNKIINYEKDKCDESWFKNLILVGGDSYDDADQFNEGELICEKAIEHMPGFTPLKVYASEQDINRRSVNNVMNQGAGFAYFCGHGSPLSWTTHFPPNGTEWTTGYEISDMIFLRNKEKQPITIVGGCHNGQFDVTLSNIILGILDDGLHYFSSEAGNFGAFWYSEWVPNSWAWFLTSKKNGGAIATIANTGLGTHGDGDSDKNGIADYLEILDGWLELRILQLYGEDENDDLGENHGQVMTEYLHLFYGNNDKWDIKMVQQWELFGDPSLKIGGYSL